LRIGIVGAAGRKVAAPATDATDTIDASRAVRSAKRFLAALRASGSQGDAAVVTVIELRRRLVGTETFAAIPDDVFVSLLLDVVVVDAVFRLTLATRSTKETFLTFAAAANARRIMRVVDASEIAPNLSATAWNACLVDALVLGSLLGGLESGS
jgi:hypothetical protein